MRPIGDDAEYDVDMVCRLGLDEANATPRGLKAEVGAALQRYANEDPGAPDSPSACREGRRCWTLDYEERFHMDVLPAIPDPPTDTGIRLTDTTAQVWLRSDPKGYAAWFKMQMDQQLAEGRRALAATLRKSIDEIPDWQVKTPLQRAVQVLKRHRDIYFAEDEADRPPSILVTTIAAHAYAGEQLLYEAVMVAGDAMANLVESSVAGWEVLNPAQPEENFADKWSEHPQRAVKFLLWATALREDIDEAARERGLEKVALRLAKSFGDPPVHESAVRLAQRYRGEREAGRLTAAASGLLAVGGAGPHVRPHEFFGLA